MTDKATIDSRLQAFYKEMGWDKPEYGWTKEKKALKSLFLEVVREDLERIHKLIWSKCPPTVINGVDYIKYDDFVKRLNS